MNRLMVRVGQNLVLVLVVTLVLGSSMWADDAASLYKVKCAACHGLDGKGSTPAGKAVGAHDFASPEIQKMTDAELSSLTSGGKNKMPGYAKTLTETQIKSLVAYIRELGKK